MNGLYFDDWLPLLVQITLFAQVSIVCLIVLVDLPSSSFICRLGRGAVVLGWLTIASNLLITYPEPLNTGLIIFAALMITTHCIKCLLVVKANRKSTPLPLADYLDIFIFGLLYQRQSHSLQRHNAD